MRVTGLLLFCSVACASAGCARSHRRELDASSPARDGGSDARVEDAYIAPDAFRPDAFRPDACAPRAEVCDGRDQDCDARIDEDAVCSIDRGIGACVAGACSVSSCDDGFADCDGDVANGCEAEVASDRGHCGACDVACRLTEACVNGTCEREQVIDITKPVHAACALLASGRVLCWGRNFAGEVGNGTLIDTAIPTQVVGISDATRISSDGTTACVMHTSGAVSCWGQGHYGTRGDGSFERDGPMPRAVDGLPAVIDIAVAAQSVCALTGDGSVWCWGRAGWLGHDLRIGDQAHPVRVMGLPSVARIHDGGLPIAETRDGEVFGWHSSLSPLTGTRTDLPQRLPSLDGAQQVDTHGVKGCATFAAGTVSCWGVMPGDASEAFRTIDTLHNVSELRMTPGGAADSSVVAIGEDGFLTTWGRRPWYPADIIGNVPTQFPGLGRVSDVEISWDHMCVLLESNRVRCMGENQHGEAGDGTTVRRTSFVSVAGFE